jgi:hypothetical protein
MEYSRRLQLLILAASLLLLSGCISQVPTPGFARTGDVINVGLGGIKRNAGGQLITTADLVVTITDSDAVVHVPRIKGVYRVYPDHTSMYAVGAQFRGNPPFGDLYPHDGAVWMTLLLVDPGSSLPLPLATGPAVLSVSSAKLTQTAKNEDGQYDSFSLEILPGTGQQSQMDNQNLAYQTEGFLSLKPSAAPAVAVGGVQVEIVFDSSVTAADPIELRVVPMHHDPNSSLIQSVTDNGDSTKTLRAMLTNPNGYVPVGAWSQGQSTLFDLELAIVSHGGGVASTATADLPTVFTVTTNSYYCDLNGDVVPGITPVLSNEIF